VEQVVEIIRNTLTYKNGHGEVGSVHLMISSSLEHNNSKCSGIWCIHSREFISSFIAFDQCGSAVLTRHRDQEMEYHVLN
jgi:hypothetical protein